MCLHSRDLANPCWHLDKGCCSLQPWCWVWNMHSPVGLSSTQCVLGNVVRLHHLDWVPLDITRLGLRPSTMYPELLKLTRPLITV